MTYEDLKVESLLNTGKFFMKASQNIKISAVALVFAAGAQTQGAETAYVPFIVNVDAMVTAVQGASNVQKTVTGGVTDTLILPLGGVSVSYYGAGRRLNAPLITGSRGNITLRLPPQSYQNAEIALHAVNGKRILRGKADASQTANGISRKNVSAGVYLLSVKGMDENAYTTRLTHGGGNLNIYVAFGNENAPHDKPLAKQIAAGDWDITIRAALYKDSNYTLKNIVAGRDNPLQYIILTATPPFGNTFKDSRDGKTYKKITIGSQTWMAENLNYAASGSKCGNGRYLSDGNTESCDTYGRLYTLTTAMDNSASPSAVSDAVRGVCPSGWHLPNNAEWDKLYRHADGTSGTESPYNSPTAGRYLKAKNGWNNCGTAGSGKSYLCEDAYGFSALPGGDGYSNGSYNYVGDYGGWWSADEYDSGLAYHRNMNHNSESAGWSNRYEDGLFSVRCVEDARPD
jgi:uncharacterized protein (TIGR02145 family)